MVVGRNNDRHPAFEGSRGLASGTRVMWRESRARTSNRESAEPPFSNGCGTGPPTMTLVHVCGPDSLPPADWVGRAALSFDDVVDLDDLGWTGELDAALGEDRHQALTERLELLL